MLAPVTSFSWFRNSGEDFSLHFADGQDQVSCKDIPGLVKMLMIEYDANEWRLFVGSTKQIHLKEFYDNL